MIATATAKYIRGSAQKARLVVDQIRGCEVENAFRVLKYSPKRAARTIEDCLKSAVANAQQADTMVDVDDLIITKAVIDPGPMMKRIRPAPMGRAHRILKRFHHITIEVSNVEE